jgi:hypothetical protein
MNPIINEIIATMIIIYTGIPNTCFLRKFSEVETIDEVIGTGWVVFPLVVEPKMEEREENIDCP